MKGKSGAEKQVTTVWPTHIFAWPKEGTMLDQPYLTVKLFSAFLEGERQGAISALT